MSQYTLDMFPAEILLHICDYVVNNTFDKISALVIFSTTCKMFYNVATMHNLWEAAINVGKLCTNNNYDFILNIIYTLDRNAGKCQLSSNIDCEYDNIGRINIIITDLKNDLMTKYVNMMRLNSIKKLQKVKMPYRSIKYNKDDKIFKTILDDYNGKITEIVIGMQLFVDKPIPYCKYRINGKKKHYNYIHKIYEPFTGSDPDEKYLHNIIYEYCKYIFILHKEYMCELQNIYKI